MDKRLTPARKDIAAKFLQGKVTSERFVEGETMHVKISATGLRREPSSKASLETELLFGEEFDVYESKDGWAWGQSQVDQYVGYIRAGDLSEDAHIATHYVTALRTYAYEKADLKSFPAMLLNMGSKVALSGEDGKFSKTSKGYVFTGHIQNLDHKAEDFVAVAEQFLGTPYLWGGRQSLGLDCSSLVQLALAQIGIAVPRDTDLIEQAVGILVGADEEKKRGDLVFWKGHIGIMVDGSRFVHANATNMAVTIDDLDSFAARIAETDGPITLVKRI